MKTQIELLAPAGNVEALHAAVENGADAVYLGGKLFNARQQADNFDISVLREALEYSHARGSSIYLTLNTLVSDHEMRQALEFAAEAGAAGIDGIIVQDPGLAAALHRVIPDIPLHGSTQMTIYDLDGAKILEEMGFNRVVLARELTLDEVSYIAANTSLEVEVFVHGALCVCYSGQCLMSSIIGGRSGNRGKCAQPCRLPYELSNSTATVQKKRVYSSAEGPGQKARYLLSPKDMCTLEHIGDIAASGIRSLKIEGRMKSPEYVAVVIRIYRKYLDMAIRQIEDGSGVKLKIAEEDMYDLLQIFNRGGFSSGYIKGRTGADMMCYEKPNNSGIYLGSISSYDRRTSSALIRLEDRLSIGDGVEIWAGASDSPGGIVSSIRKGGSNLKTAGKGETVSIGNFKGRINPGLRVYKTTDIQLMKSARESFTGRNLKRVGINGRITLKKGQTLSLLVKDDEGHSVYSEGTLLPELALMRPLTEERLKDQMGKTGSTPFAFDELVAETEEGLSLPVSEINEVRRKALEELLKVRMDRYGERRGSACDMDEVGKRIASLLDGGAAGSIAGDTAAGSFSVKGHKSVEGKITEPQLSLYFYKWDADTDYSELGADRLYLPITALDKPGFSDQAHALRDAGSEVFLWLPSVTRGNYAKLIERLAGKTSVVFDGLLVGNIGTIHRLKGLFRLGETRVCRLAGDISMNVFNSQSVLEFAGRGLESIALSAELTLQQIHALVKPGSPALEAAVYGRLPLMTSEYCPAGCVEGGFKASDKCSGCCGKNGYNLKDRMGAEFPVFCDRVDCRSTILNSNVLFLPDSLCSLNAAGVDIFRLYIWDEEPSVVGELVQLYRAVLAGDDRGVAEHGPLADKIKAAGFTKGHYFRGV